MTDKEPILFFDGTCNLCNFWVDFVLTRDRKGTMFFASLQGATAHKLLPSPYTSAIETVVLHERDIIYTQSDAILRTLHYLGGVWECLGKCLRICPASLRNGMYSQVSKRRYQIFGRRATCRVPSSQERQRFLE